MFIVTGSRGDGNLAKVSWFLQRFLPPFIPLHFCLIDSIIVVCILVLLCGLLIRFGGGLLTLQGAHSTINQDAIEFEWVLLEEGGEETESNTLHPLLHTLCFSMCATTSQTQIYQDQLKMSNNAIHCNKNSQMSW
jgi:hypothetical protein